MELVNPELIVVAPLKKVPAKFPQIPKFISNRMMYWFAIVLAFILLSVAIKKLPAKTV